MDLFERAKELGEGWRSEIVPKGEMIDSYGVLVLKEKSSGKNFVVGAKTSLDVWKDDVTFGVFANTILGAMRKGYDRKGYEVSEAKLISKEFYEKAMEGCSEESFFSFHEDVDGNIVYFKDGEKVEEKDLQTI